MKTIGQFNEMLARLPALLDRLQLSPALNRDGLSDVPKRGIYAFYEDEGQGPIYVGRSDRMRERLLEHSRPSSWSNSATFAFLLAEKNAQKQGIDNPPFTRATVRNVPEHRELFLQAKECVSTLKIRVVDIEDPIEQTVFEVYAALALETRYNSFKNH